MSEKLPQKKKFALWKKVLIGLIVVGVIAKFVQPPLNKENGRSEAKLTMAYVKAKRSIKEALKDPASFEEIVHKEYYQSGPDSAKNNIQVIIQYRAKNSFGGFVVEKKAINFDSTGKITDSYIPE